MKIQDINGDIDSLMLLHIKLKILLLLLSQSQSLLLGQLKAF